MARIFPALLFPTASSAPSPRCLPSPSSSRSYVYSIRRIDTGKCYAAATGTTGCFTFPREIASKLHRQCTCAHLATMTLTLRLHVEICWSKRLLRNRREILICVKHSFFFSFFICKFKFLFLRGTFYWKTSSCFQICNCVMYQRFHISSFFYSPS